MLLRRSWYVKLSIVVFISDNPSTWSKKHQVTVKLEYYHKQIVPAKFPKFPVLSIRAISTDFGLWIAGVNVM